MPSKFITNQKELLSEIMHDILPSCDQLFFLVGYFYFTGFEALYKNLGDKNIKILIGMEIEKDIHNKIKEFEIIQEVNLSRGEIKQRYYHSLVQLFNDTDYFDTLTKQEAFTLFLQKIQDGSLEIRKTLQPNHAKLYLFQKKEEFSERGRYPGVVITGSSNLSLSGLKQQFEINVLFRDEHFEEGKAVFDQLWEQSVDIVRQNNYDQFEHEVIEKIWYEKLTKPFLMYLRVLDEYFQFEKMNIRLPQEITEHKYFNLKYQTDAIQRAIHILRIHNGVLIADVVGMGKSIVASAVAHNLGMKAMVIAPPHLTDQWNDYRYEYDFNAKVYSSGNVEKALEEQTDREEKLIIVDEAHKFRNEETNDYAILHRLCQGNKIILLTATPFNNRPQDIFSLIKLFQIPTKSTIQTVDSLSYQFKELIKEYRDIDKAKKDQTLSKSEEKTRIQGLARKIRALTAPLLIRRSRIDLQEIDEYRDDLQVQKIELNEIDPPNMLDYELGDLSELYIRTLERIYPSNPEKQGFIGARYKPTSYLKDSEKFKEQIDRDFGDQNLFLQSQVNIAEFMQRLLVRRFESSIFAFRTSLDNMIRSAQSIKDWFERLGKVPIYKKGKLPDIDTLLDLDNEDAESEANDINFEDQLHEYVEKGLVLIDRSELKESFIQDVERDIDLLQNIRQEWFGNDMPPDPKLDSLKHFLQKCLDENPKRKIVVFTEFADTANYLKKTLDGDLRLFKYTSDDANVTNKRTIRTNFDAGLPTSRQKNDHDVLIATDAISEGFNLHRAGIIFNYDIPYNPTRVIQRVGRINRINKKVFDHLEIYNFFPTATGEQQIRVGQIATLKIHMIHALLGGDTQVLTDEEELASYFKEMWDRAWQAQEERSWDVDYLNLLNRFKMNQPDMIQKARAIPRRSRVRRSTPKDQKGVIVFGRKGEEYTFKLGLSPVDVVDLTAEDSIRLFEADVNEKPEKVSEAFESIYQFVKANLFKRKSQVPMDRGRQQTVSIIQWLLKELPDHKDYLNDLLQVVNILDSLPKFSMKIIRVLGKKVPEELLEEIQSMVPHVYLTRILEKARRIEEGEETIILSEELI